jgi:pyruvate kinase
MKKPKIICTLGTTTDDKRVLEEMVKAGMQCARMNTAYATIPEYQERLDLLREVADVDVMMDIKGPQVRLAADNAYPIEEGDIIYAGFKDEPIHFNKDFYQDVKIGDRLLIENGTIETKVRSKGNRRLALDIVEPGEGVIHKQMGVNVPGRYLHVQRLSKKDLQVANFAVENDVEYIALSFVRKYSDVANLQRAINILKNKHGKDNDIGIVAKIEDGYGITNLQDIIGKSRQAGINLSVMVARGDMYVELPRGQLPYAQEGIIQVCRENNVFVITGTGVLESLQYQQHPTRAEVNDVYNAMVQGSNALMLSGETSNSCDPANATRVLAGLIDGYAKMRENGD